jgi:hypothetical protein
MRAKPALVDIHCASRGGFWASTDGRACNRLTSPRESHDRGSYRYAGNASDLHDAGPARDLEMATNLHLGFVNSSPSGWICRRRAPGKCQQPAFPVNLIAAAAVELPGVAGDVKSRNYRYAGQILRL